GAVADAGVVSAQHACGAVAVAGGVMRAGADQGEAMRQAGVQRQVLADLNARHCGADWPKRPADGGRRLRLPIVGFQLTGPAPQEHENDGSLRRGRGLSTQAEQVGQAQASQAEETGAEKVAASNVVAALVSGTGEGKHGKSPWEGGWGRIEIG